MKVLFGWALSLALVSSGCSAADPGMPVGAVAGAGGASRGELSGISSADGIAGAGPVVRPASARVDGQAIAPWDRYCVATFTSAWEVLDSFDDVQLEIQPGDRYVLGKPGFFDEAKIVYIADVGPVTFDLKLEDGVATPFMSSCQGRATRTYSAVFVDTSVYSDKEKTMLSCTLPAGLAVPGDGINYVITSGGGDPMSLTYQVDLKQLAPHCNGVSKGFIGAARITVGELSTYAIPIGSVLGPTAL